jgi:hypothetical protein
VHIRPQQLEQRRYRGFRKNRHVVDAAHRCHQFGAIFGLQAMGTKNDAQPNCSSNFATCNQKGLDTIDDGKSKATISTIGFIARQDCVAKDLMGKRRAIMSRSAF